VREKGVSSLTLLSKMWMEVVLEGGLSSYLGDIIC
jgi:hypothetical protein